MKLSLLMSLSIKLLYFYYKSRFLDLLEYFTKKFKGGTLA